MKKAFDDVKSFVTVAFTISLIALLFIAVFKSEAIFETVFLLFTNLCTAVFTYFFTKKSKEETTSKNETKELGEDEIN